MGGAGKKEGFCTESGMENRAEDSVGEDPGQPVTVRETPDQSLGRPGQEGGSWYSRFMWQRSLVTY